VRVFYEFLSVEQELFSWSRADSGYFWDDLATSKKAYPGPFLVPSPDTQHFLRYRPLESEPKLFLRFSELAPEQDAILEFANEFGWLTEGIPITTVQRQATHGGDPLYPLEGEALDFWRYEVAQMRTALQFHEWIQEQNIGALREIASPTPNGAGVRFDLDFQGTWRAQEETRHEILDHLSPGELLLPAKLALMQQVNWKLHRKVAPRLVLTGTNEFGPYLVPTDLLSALWLQLFQTVVGERRIRRCKLCGHWEDVSDKTRRWNVHADCANRERVRRSRAG
jgi:hypothetical protein